ncbi:putative Zn-dependent protease with MMP-like domain [Psychromicrobium silvestre]|uniref:Putative Zn-dependent protease with MMP-like domain n=1 Tax=Psychromicrobium silvestre TaxID=1645614 RepID=A0A7Y9LVU6_9MICC|nr:metallopeptidase family protein [Psychromicrobium silvestre]NYE96550.1 putative Zn-dependent protease with MMP-like domain [Psychromicrobium silvestre]
MEFEQVKGWRFRFAATAESSGAAAHSGGRSFLERRRDRHGRGLRGALLIAPLPGARSRSERFDDLVVDSAERLEDIWGASMDRLQFAVEEIPGNLEELVASGDSAPFAAYRPAQDAAPASITIFRRPILQRVESDEDLREVVHDAVVEQVAVYLNLSPEAVDPLYGRTRRF